MYELNGDYEEKIDESTTHLVCGDPKKRGEKVLLAILAGYSLFTCGFHY